LALTSPTLNMRKQSAAPSSRVKQLIMERTISHRFSGFFFKEPVEKQETEKTENET
jgi:hypothetical protein